MKITYIGVYEEVRVPCFGMDRVFKRGVEAEIPEAIGAQLLTQNPTEWKTGGEGTVNNG